jgi:replicative superfamily II helicase
MIGDPYRGSAIEAALVRLTSKNSRVRLVLLSGTFGNPFEIASWVKTLNGKETKCVISKWRPCKVAVTFHVVEDAPGRIESALEIAERLAPGEKTVMFVHSKILGKELLGRLKANGVKCAFHNASVPGRKRLEMERMFNDPMSGSDVLISTSTLSSGVNLGAGNGKS